MGSSDREEIDEPRSGLSLVGVEGYFARESYRIERGQAFVVGRSRGCGISLQRTAKFANGERARAVEDPNFRKVSREHFRISFLHPYLVEIENLSGNGTFIDGERVDRVLLSDFRSRSYEIAFGGREKLRLEWESDGS